MTPERFINVEGKAAASPNSIDSIDALNEIAWELRNKEPERARSLAERALDLAQSFEIQGHPYLRGKAQSLCILGDLAIKSDAFGLALTRLLEAYALLQEQMFPELLADACYSIGWAHFRLGNQKEALDFIHQAFGLFQKVGNKARETAALTSLGSVYNITDPPLAMEYFQRALKMQVNQPVSRDQGVTLNNLAYAQINLQAYADAIRNATAAIELFRKLNLSPSEASGLDTLGQAYYEMGSLENAEEALNQCLFLARLIPSDHQEMEAMLKLGKVYIKQGRLELAKEHISQAVRLADIRHLNQYRYKYHELLAKINEEMGNLPATLHHLKQHHAAMELSLAEAANYRLDNLRILHQVEKNQKEAEVLGLYNLALEREIDERRRERVEREKEATTDPLTGLYNRRHFFTLGEYEFEKARQQQMQIAVIMLDIDHFKSVNDQYSHAIGDQALIAVARLLTHNARKGDICCRYGGEEFLILLPDTPLANAYEAAERLRLAIFSAPIDINEHHIPLTVSIGLAQAAVEDGNLQAVIERADQALYRAKSVGRNRISQ